MPDWGNRFGEFAPLSNAANELRHVVAVRALGGYRLWLKFDDGDQGEIDLEPVLQPFENLFAALRDPVYFAKVKVSRTLGTICWPNGIDLDPDVLYHRATGKPLPF